MSGTYPKIGSKKKPNPKAHPNNGSPCLVCQKKTTGSIEFQVNWFRGDDEHARFCEICQKLPTAEIIAAFMLRPTLSIAASTTERAE